jgi:endonuclease
LIKITDHAEHVNEFKGGQGSQRTNKVFHDLGFDVRPLDEDDDIIDAELEQAEEVKFTLERDLQSALRSNIEQLEQGLKITDLGHEKGVPSGKIDITAEDKNGATVVIELKAGEATHNAIGQILGYMGDLTTDKNLVRGILVAGDFSKKAVAAARVVPHLQLRRYGFNFTFEHVGSEQRSSVATR